MESTEPNIEEKETIVGPAILLTNGRVEIGASHDAITRTLFDEAMNLLEGRKEGFTTSKGRFVDRGEAFVIASNAGQLKPYTLGNSLSSQDLK